MSARGAIRIDPLREVQRTDDRGRLVEIHERHRRAGSRWIRKQVIQNRRVDILARFLGYDVEPLHLAIARHQMSHDHTLTLALRGCGKSTTGNICRVIQGLLADPDRRFLIASKAHTQAQDFLREIRAHIEADHFVETFGDIRGDRWDTIAITVKRKRRSKEPSVLTVGVEGALVSKHFDEIIGDDLVDEGNSRTKYSRNLVKTWYLKVLDPCLEPGGAFHHLGTRYHPDDLWNDLTRAGVPTLVIPALRQVGDALRSPWPSKFPVAWLQKKKTKLGTLIFNSQYQCDTEAMKGAIFAYDDCQPLGEGEVPRRDELKVYLGVDLAISESDVNDCFAIVVVGIDDQGRIFVLDHLETRCSFPKQTNLIIDYADRWKADKVGIEVNAYQKAQYQNTLGARPDLKLIPIFTGKDKTTRAHKLTAYFEAGRVYFAPGNQRVIDVLVTMPESDLKDLFDGFDLALGAAFTRTRRKRRREPGLM